MKEHIEIAAKWWADQFRNGTKQDAGDAMINAFTTMCASKFSVTPEQADAFEAALIAALPDHLSEGWQEENPQWGSTLRTLSTDYGADRALRAAAKSAGIDGGCPPFPMKTVMWIDPDKVRVRHGYSAPIVVLWPNKELSNKSPAQAGKQKRKRAMKETENIRATAAALDATYAALERKPKPKKQQPESRICPHCKGSKTEPLRAKPDVLVFCPDCFGAGRQEQCLGCGEWEPKGFLRNGRCGLCAGTGG